MTRSDETNSSQSSLFYAKRLRRVYLSQSPLSSLIESCMKQEYSDEIDLEGEGEDLNVASVERLTADESQTWLLVHCLTTIQPFSLALLEWINAMKSPFSSAIQKLDQFHQQRCFNRSGKPFKRPTSYLTSGAWPRSKSFIAMDPDGPLRSEQPLHPLDQQNDRHYAQQVWQNLLQGEYETAIHLCEWDQYDQGWRTWLMTPVKSKRTRKPWQLLLQHEKLVQQEKWAIACMQGESVGLNLQEMSWLERVFVWALFQQVHHETLPLIEPIQHWEKLQFQLIQNGIDSCLQKKWDSELFSFQVHLSLIFQSEEERSLPLLRYISNSRENRLWHPFLPLYVHYLPEQERQSALIESMSNQMIQSTQQAEQWWRRCERYSCGSIQVLSEAMFQQCVDNQLLQDLSQYSCDSVHRLLLWIPKTRPSWWMAVLTLIVAVLSHVSREEAAKVWEKELGAVMPTAGLLDAAWAHLFLQLRQVLLERISSESVMELLKSSWGLDWQDSTPQHQIVWFNQVLQWVPLARQQLLNECWLLVDWQTTLHSFAEWSEALADPRTDWLTHLSKDKLKLFLKSVSL